MSHADTTDLGELIAFCQKAALDLGAEKPSVTIESVGIHGFVATVPGMSHVISGKGRTAVDAASDLLKNLVGKMKLSD